MTLEMWIIVATVAISVIMLQIPAFMAAVRRPRVDYYLLADMVRETVGSIIVQMPDATREMMVDASVLWLQKAIPGVKVETWRLLVVGALNKMKPPTTV